MRIKFLGAAKEVTGSSFLVDIDSLKVLIDAGSFQGKENFVQLDEDVDYAVITHAHIDHIGNLPLIYKRIKRNIISTTPTKKIADLMLRDAMKVAEERGEKPLYSEEDLLKIEKKWIERDYKNPLEFGDLKITLFDAGHIIGSASVLIELKNLKLLFTGDIGDGRSRVLKKPDVPKGHIDYLIIESTYGDRINPPPEKVEEEIKEIVYKKGIKRILIPAFALGRVEEVLYFLKEIEIPIYLDSPLANKILELHQIYFPFLKEKVPSDFITPVRSRRSSLELAEDKKRKIIIASSGMLEGGRVMNHLPSILPDPEAAILFTGYQVEGTLGRRILEGAKEVEIEGNIIPVNCKVLKLNGLSAHADQNGLLNYIEKLEYYPYKTFIVHGEENASISLKEKLKERKIFSYIPDRGEEVKVITSSPENNVIIDMPVSFSILDKGIEIFPLIGWLVKEEEKIKIEPKDWVFNYIAEKEKELSNIISSFNTSHLPVKENREKRSINPISEREFYEKLKNLREKTYLSKKKLKEIRDESIKGKDSLLSWLEVNYKKQRLYAPDKNINEEIYGILKRGFSSLDIKVIQFICNKLINAP